MKTIEAIAKQPAVLRLMRVRPVMPMAADGPMPELGWLVGGWHAERWFDIGAMQLRKVSP